MRTPRSGVRAIARASDVGDQLRGGESHAAVEGGDEGKHGAPTVSRHFSSRARIESRSGVRVGIDAVSTAMKRLFNGDKRRRSLAMPSMCHALGDGSRRADPKTRERSSR